MNVLLKRFDGRPSIFLAFCELQAILELLSSIATVPIIKRYVPRGQDQPVLILPGFLQIDISTINLQRFLRSIGYTVYVSELGLNRGYSDGLDLMLGRRLKEVY
ncbi:MAG: hypothetical protein AAB969_00740 [Patescibacteria group bacterium]